MANLKIPYAKYQITRRAVLSGEPLYDMKEPELKQFGYQSSVWFNVTESLFAGVPGLILMLILFLGVQPLMMNEAVTGVSYGDVLPELLLSCIFLTLWVFIPPVYAGSVAPFAGRGSIRAEDRTPALKSRATRAYLYYDGSYGLKSQALIGLAYVLLLWLSMNVALLPFMGVATIGLFAASIYQLYLSFSKIPKLMFANNGYSVRVRRFWQKKRADDPPWNRYHLYFIGGGILTGIALGFLMSGIESVLLMVTGG